MKHIILLMLILCMVIPFTGCNDDTPFDTEPEISQMRAICQLATLECYYHNVVTIDQKNAESFLWWSKDKTFWIEYSGSVKYGVDMSLVNLKIEDTNITITIPKAKVFENEVVVDSSSINIIIDKDSAKVTAEDQSNAIQEAKQDMINTAANDKTLILNAQNRVQVLIENYINNIGEMTGKEYTIKWVYLNEETEVNAS